MNSLIRPRLFAGAVLLVLAGASQHFGAQRPTSSRPRPPAEQEHSAAPGSEPRT